MASTPFPALDAAPEDVADALLLGLLRQRAGAVRVEPSADGGHVLHVPGLSPESLPLSRELAEALAVRLGILADLDPWAAATQAARFRVRAGGQEAEVEVALPTPRTACGPSCGSGSRRPRPPDPGRPRPCSTRRAGWDATWCWRRSGAAACVVYKARHEAGEG